MIEIKTDRNTGFSESTMQGSVYDLTIEGAAILYSIYKSIHNSGVNGAADIFRGFITHEVNNDDFWEIEHDPRDKTVVFLKEEIN